MYEDNWFCLRKSDMQSNADSYLIAGLEFHKVECLTSVIFRQVFCLIQLVNNKL